MPVLQCEEVTCSLGVLQTLLHFWGFETTLKQRETSRRGWRWRLSVMQKWSVCHPLFLSLLSDLLTFCLSASPHSAWLMLIHTETHRAVSYPALTLTSVIMLWCFHVPLSVQNGDTLAFLPVQLTVARDLLVSLCAQSVIKRFFADVRWYLRALGQLFEHSFK